MNHFYGLFRRYYQIKINFIEGKCSQENYWFVNRGFHWSKVILHFATPKTKNSIWFIATYPNVNLNILAFFVGLSPGNDKCLSYILYKVIFQILCIMHHWWKHNISVIQYLYIFVGNTSIYPFAMCICKVRISMYKYLSLEDFPVGLGMYLVTHITLVLLVFFRYTGMNF